MGDFIEHAPKWIAVATVCALAFAVAHEFGYFWIIGAHFQTVVSTFDYFVNTLIWAPSALVIITIVQNLSDFIVRPKLNETPRLPRNMFRFNLVLIALSSALSFFVGGSFVYVITMLFCFFTISYGLRLYANRFSDVSWPLYRFLLMGPLILALSFYYGTSIARSDLRKFDDVYFLKLKSDAEPRPVIMLRGFEKGLLIRTPQNSRVEFIRWDETISISRSATVATGPSLSCLWFEWFCKPEESRIP